MKQFTTQMRIFFIKMQIRLHLFLNRSSMTERTSRLLADLVDLEGAPLEKQYRITK